MRTHKADCGLEVIQCFFEALGIREEQCIREERGFTWWGEDLAQRVWSDPAVDRDGTRVWKVHARTDFLTGFIDTAENFGFLTELAAHSSLGGGLIRDESHRDRIQLASCLYAIEPTQNWAKAFFPTIAATQAAEAHLMAKKFPELVHCSAAYSVHPVAGPGKHHGALDVLGSWVRAGRQSSVWKPEDFEDTAVEVAGVDGSLLSVSGSGLRIGLPFADSKAICEITTETVHQAYRNGLYVRLKMPIILSDVEEPEIVLRCNAHELNSLTQASHCSGSYSVAEDGVSYINFAPNMASFRSVPFLSSMVRLMAARARWFAEAVRGEDWPIFDAGKQSRDWLN